MKSRRLAKCCVCGGCLEEVFALPSLPVTGIYSKASHDPSFPTYDQAFALCPSCQHGQLSEALDPTVLYGGAYGFRTSESATARKGSEFFAAYLHTLFPGRKFRNVVDFGCNDGVLLGLLEGSAERRVGIDPILRGKEREFKALGIEAIGMAIEDANLDSVLDGPPDLIVSQHTFEHLTDPRRVLETLLAMAAPETVFVFEFPCLDVLLRHYRFDQVFHQHVQYFSVASVMELLQRVGAEPIGYTFNFGYWGALLIAFRRGTQAGGGAVTHEFRMPSITTAAILQRYGIFREQLALASRIIASLAEGETYGYGAALMLPILAYHLDTDFAMLRAILDDDPNKAGLGYVNLPVRIVTPSGVDLSDATIVDRKSTRLNSSH